MIGTLGHAGLHIGHLIVRHIKRDDRNAVSRWKEPQLHCGRRHSPTTRRLAARGPPPSSFVASSKNRRNSSSSLSLLSP